MSYVPYDVIRRRRREALDDGSGQALGQPLAAVAITGSYADLVDKPDMSSSNVHFTDATDAAHPGGVTSADAGKFVGITSVSGAGESKAFGIGLVPQPFDPSDAAQLAALRSNIGFTSVGGDGLPIFAAGLLGSVIGDAETYTTKKYVDHKIDVLDAEKADIDHQHEPSDILGLSALLQSKADVAHTHAGLFTPVFRRARVTDLDGYIFNIQTFWTFPYPIYRAPSNTFNYIRLTRGIWRVRLNLRLPMAGYVNTSTSTGGVMVIGGLSVLQTPFNGGVPHAAFAPSMAFMWDDDKTKNVIVQNVYRGPWTDSFLFPDHQVCEQHVYMHLNKTASLYLDTYVDVYQDNVLLMPVAYANFTQTAAMTPSKYIKIDLNASTFDAFKLCELSGFGTSGGSSFGATGGAPMQEGAPYQPQNYDTMFASMYPNPDADFEYAAPG